MMLYLHLPFCRKKCAYCAFCSGDFSLQQQKAYIDQLIRMIRHYCRDRLFSTIYIGGGTPSVLPLPLWHQLLSEIKECIDLSALTEFTVELNPESTDGPLLQLLKEYGVNRLSFGVQSLSDAELSAIGRLHDRRTALQSISLAKKIGFDNIGADLIYGLPMQTVDSFTDSLRTLLDSPITHLSCYNLQLEEGTALYAHKEQYTFADEEQQLAMYDQLISLTKAAGFAHYEISNFARTGYRAVHNSGYWNGTDYIGLGLSAHSKIGNCRFSFTEKMDEFLNNADLSFDECTPLTEEDKRQEQIMLGLRTDKGAPLSLLNLQKVQKYIDGGLGQIQEDHFVLNEQGFLVSNTIIADLM